MLDSVNETAREMLLRIRNSKDKAEIEKLEKLMLNIKNQLPSVHKIIARYEGRLQWMDNMFGNKTNDS